MVKLVETLSVLEPDAEMDAGLREGVAPAENKGGRAAKEHAAPETISMT